MTPNEPRQALLHCQRCGRSWRVRVEAGEKYPVVADCRNCGGRYRVRDYGNHAEMEPRP